MKTKIRQRMIAMALAGMMIAAPVGGSVYAADEAIAEQAQPVAAAEVKEEVKEEPKVEAKVEAKAEVKEEVKKEVKKEVKEEVKEELTEAPAEKVISNEAKAAEAAEVKESNETEKAEAPAAEAKPAETRKQASSYKVTIRLEGIKLAGGSESTETLSYTVYTNGSKTISASTLNAKVRTKSMKIDGVTYKFEGLWADASGNEVSSIYINGADLWDPTELVYRAVYSATPDKKVTVNFTGIIKTDGSIVESSESNTLSAGCGWSFTQKKLDNKVLAKSFSLNGDKYEYSGKWMDDKGNEFSSLSIKNSDLEGDTVITVHPVYNITECKKLSFNRIDNVSTAGTSWANNGETASVSHTFKQPDPQEHYSFMYWQNKETGDTYKAGDTLTVKLADLPEIHNELNVYTTWQPSVTVRYHYNGNTVETENFDSINVYDKSAEIDGVEYNAWYDEAGNILADGAAFEAPAPVTEKVDRTIYNVYARRPVTIKAASAEWTFDGQAHSDDSVSVTAGGLFEGDEIVAEVSGSITAAGEAANAIESVKIMRNGADVSEYYDITTENGLLSVKAAPAPAAKTDNGTPAAPATKEDKGTPAAPKNRPAAPAARTADNQAAAEIVEQGTPMAAPEAFIADSDTPLAANNTWALLNLIMTVITGIISAVLLTGYFGKKEDEEDENEDAETKRKGFVRLASIIPAAGAIIAFILTEDMTNMMAFTDRWTILMAVILLIQAVTAILAKKEKEESEETAETI